MKPRITHVALTLVVVLWPILTVAQSAGEARPPADPLWVKILLGMAGGVIAALVTGFFGLRQTRKKFENDLKMMDGQLRRDITRLDHQISQQLVADIQRIDSQTKIQLSADIQKIERQIAEQLRAEARTQAARLRERYVNALPFHTGLLKQQISAVQDKLKNDREHKMQRWFKRIKNHCEGKLDSDDSQPADPFPPWCHYEGIFAMSTLYYTSVFFLYSQQLRSLSPFSELDTDYGEGLARELQKVGDAFARRGINEEEKGLWDRVQDNMGAAVRKGDWYKSYNEFSRIFIELEPPREDHVFLRALDFFGAYGDQPCALLDTEGAESIIRALEDLLHFLRTTEAARQRTNAELPHPRAQCAGTRDGDLDDRREDSDG
jgi:hypothetical protein